VAHLQRPIAMALFGNGASRDRSAEYVSAAQDARDLFQSTTTNAHGVDHHHRLDVSSNACPDCPQMVVIPAGSFSKARPT
jgi:hypothetical protein